MHKLGTGYTKYFNQKYNRSGSLLEGRYKAIYVKENSYLLWLSAYVNGNSEVHQIAPAKNYPWSSYMDYLDKRNDNICNKPTHFLKCEDKEKVLEQFTNIQDYKDFVQIVIQEAKAGKEERKRYILE